MIRKKQVIAILSIVLVSFLVGTSMATDGGNPFEALWEAIYGVHSRTDSLEVRVEDLEGMMLPQGFASAPAYDSGWVAIEQDEVLELRHNLNTTEVVVYLIGKWDYNAKIHQRAYGSVNSWGAFWYDLDSKNIRVNRRTNDATWNYVRVQMWKIQEPTS